MTSELSGTDHNKPIKYADLPAHTAHRPWSTPSSPWVFRMRWLDLAFLHWQIDPQQLRPFVPERLQLDLHGGKAWLGVVPFKMSDTMVRGIPALPYFSQFPELNVRTYVTIGGKPGVWFFSLDAANLFAVRMARTIFNLPYFHARMSCQTSGGSVEYKSERVENPNAGQELETRFHARYAPSSEIITVPRSSIVEWFTERYCLYSAAPNGKLFRGEIHHQRWPLHEAHCEILSNTMTAPLGIDLSTPPAYVHFVKRLDVIGWLIEPV
jgi:uncharacterized protein